MTVCPECQRPAREAKDKVEKTVGVKFFVCDTEDCPVATFMVNMESNAKERVARI